MRSRFHGAILGLAIGDALGGPVEFMRPDEIRQLYGPEGITELEIDPLLGVALYTDDTQMSIALANGLLAVPYGEFEAQMEAVAREFVAWSVSPENNRAPGNTCMGACANLSRGVPWWEAGRNNSKGCGTSMRTAPIGLLCHGDWPQLERLAIESSRITHGHPAGLAGGLATAAAVSLALDDTPPETLIRQVAERGRPHSDELAVIVERVLEVADRPAAEAMAALGQGWVAEEANALAFSCVLAHPDDYAATIRRAVNIQGDRDSVACIAGAISGAYLGVDAIDPRWREAIENGDELVALADRLYDAWAGRQG